MAKFMDDDEKNSALFYAAWNGEREDVWELLKQGAKPVHVEQGYPILYNPIVNNDDWIAVALINAGADPNAEFPGGLFPLYAAAEFGNLAIISKLITAGAEIDKLTPKGCTALRNAVEEGHYQVAEYLLMNGADPTAVNNAGNSIVDAAMRYGHYDIAELVQRYIAAGAARSQRAYGGGSSLAWKAVLSRQSGLVEARAKVPLLDMETRFAPGEDLAPRMTAPSPKGGNSFRQVYVWDAPEASIETDNGTIVLRGLKQSIEAVNPSYAALIERESVTEHGGLLVIGIGDTELYLQGRPEVAEALLRMFGVEEGVKHSSSELEWEAIENDDDGSLIGIDATAPNGFCRVFWRVSRMKCPAIRCLVPYKAFAEECYLWDQPDTLLEYPEDNILPIKSLKQLCSEQCPEILEKLEKEVFSFMGLAVVSSKIADELYSEATSEKLYKRYYNFS